MAVEEVVDVYSGDVPLVMTAHLAVAPLPQYPSLDTLVEASWPGYAPAPLSLVSRYNPADGIDMVGATVLWRNTTEQEQTPAAMYLTAPDYGGIYLVSYVLLPVQGFQLIPPGGSTWGLVLTGYPQSIYVQ